MTAKNRAAALARIQARYPQCCIVHGWRLSGPGPAIFGWWAVYATGYSDYLGKSLAVTANYRAA
jgi:hypothetical protein